MLVTFRELKPNPWRNFAIDPIDDAHVESLRASMREFGYWGGIVARSTPDGSLETCDGHHRVKAAMAEGIEQGDVAIVEMDDDAMIQAMAMAQATQGDRSQSQFTVVLAACRIVSRRLPAGKHLTWGPVCKLIGDLPEYDRRTIRRMMKTLAASSLI